MDNCAFKTACPLLRFGELQALERQWEAQSTDFANYWLRKRSFWLWRQSGALAASATNEKLSKAMSMAFENTSSMVLMRWQQWVALQHERRRRLAQAFALVVETDERSSLQHCFGVWQRYRRQGQLLSAKSDVAFLHSRKRVLQVDHFTALCEAFQHVTAKSGLTGCWY